MMEDDDDVPMSRLEKPIKIGDLLNKCSDFSIKSEDICEQEEDTDISQVYAYEKLEPFCLLENLEAPSSDEDNNDDDELDVAKSFPVFRKKMNNLTDDGKIMKLIERHGDGMLMPEDNGEPFIAYVHYAAWVELAEYPFDVTRLRHKKPYRMVLGIGEVLQGVEKGIRSMRKGEKSKFLIHPDLAFGPSGVPPRIPPNATILFDIELFDFCPDEKKSKDYLNEQPETIEDRINKAKKCRERGNKKKKHEKNVNGAISQYRRGIYILVSSKFANEDEEALAHEELSKLYENLAVCHSTKGEYKKVCSTFNDAMRDCPEKAKYQPKLYFVSAKALRNLADYPEAKRRLQLALKLRPKNGDILKELQNLEEAVEKHKKFERNMCANIFNFRKGEDWEKEEEEKRIRSIMEIVADDFKEHFELILDDFMNDETKMTDRLEGDLTLQETEFCKYECKKRNLVVKEIDKGIIFQKRAL